MNKLLQGLYACKYSGIGEVWLKWYRGSVAGKLPSRKGIAARLAAV